MNKAFSCLLRGGKKASKYFIFSFLFVFACLFGTTELVKGANTDFPYSNGDSIHQGNNVCSASHVASGYLTYTIRSSNYRGSGVANCVSYTFTSSSRDLFYLQGNDGAILTPNTTTLQTIQFAIDKSILSDYTHIAVFEQGSTLGSGSASYDLYNFSNASTFSYTLVKNASSSENDSTYYADSNGSLNTTKGSLYISSDTLEFSYALRNPVYGLNNIFVYFYNATPVTSNPSQRANIEFHLAKPIADFSTELKEEVRDCKANTDADAPICVVYKNGTLHTGESHIKVLFPKNAAFYFSTINNHSGVEKTYQNIANYNSIYAINEFKNQDATNMSVIYYYYNVSDETTTYSNTTNSKINLTEESKNYTMDLTMDANGQYKFIITDIFSTSYTTEAIEVTDTSNRELDIYFLDKSGTDANLNLVKNNETIAEFFTIDASGNKLTNKNVKIVLEYYFTILINDENGIDAGGSNPSIYEKIRSNPLKEEDLNKGNTTYCKTFVSNVSGEIVIGCLTGNANTQFNNKSFDNSQSISATYAGLNNTKENENDYSIGSITNTFTFTRGYIHTDNVSSSSNVKNQTFTWVNENGRYLYLVTDNYGNNKSAWIDVSIIDQLQPVFSSDASIVGGETKICTSTYVYGGNSEFAAPIFGESGYNADCLAKSVTYDVTENEPNVDTGKQAISRFDLLTSTGLTVADRNHYVYYNLEGRKSFNYDDAIRIARLMVVDNITALASADSSTKSITAKSTYRATNATFEAYGLTTRNIETNDSIIKGNYIQYSSELDSYNKQLMIRVQVLGQEIVCSDDSGDGLNSCYDIVNNYIDRSIDFTIIFNAKDFVGNVSNDFVIEVKTIDDTTPGILNINNETGAIIDGGKSAVQVTNIDTNCRLEIGNNIQNKNTLLNCYGLATKESDSNNIIHYNIVDNKSGLMGAAGTLDKVLIDNTNFGNVLSYQWYRKYAAYDYNIKVEIYLNNEWREITNETTFRIDNANYYKLRFTITDNNLQSGTDSNYNYNNTTELIVWYYVNPKLLLIAPNAQTKEYGSSVDTLTYRVYSSSNVEAFYNNLFMVSASELPTFLRNYEDVTDTGESQYLVLENRKLTGQLKLIEKKKHDSAGAGIYTEDHKNINEEEVRNAGLYYMTLGDIKVCITNSSNECTSIDENNYIIRLHPAYLINGKVSQTTLKSYDHTDVKENVSNIYLTITQKILSISANGGSKMYGVVDTNYKYYNTNDSITNSDSKKAYLNGYTVDSGFVEEYGDSVATEYNGISLINGALRRVAGEKVGTYKICNFAGNPNGYADNGMNCLKADSSKWELTSSTLVKITTTNVFYLDTDGTYKTINISNDDDLTLGMYVKNGEKYYKITAANLSTDTDGTYINIYDDTWTYSYDGKIYDLNDGRDDALQITANPINNNKNYVISYNNDKMYTVTTRNLVIQPGINQGKEYSAPAHQDPIWQIVVYGEIESSIAIDNNGFNGYTANIGLSYSHTVPDNSVYTYAGVPETEIYFNRRKSADANNIYIYKYTINILNNVFTLDGVEYKVADDKSTICRNTNRGEESECYPLASGEYIIGGINHLTITDNVITVSLTGNLTYQNYTLFTNAAGEVGEGTISRVSGEVVGWYGFNNNLTDLKVKNDGLTNELANYTSSYNDNAPSMTSNVGDIMTFTTFGGNPHNETYNMGEASFVYTPDGINACTSDAYTEKCSGDKLHHNNGITAPQNRVLFEIFKRDIIISFKFQSDNYGLAYNDYLLKFFAFNSTNNATPKNSLGNEMIICYRKASDEVTTGLRTYRVNGVDYVQLSSDLCSNADYGLAENDNWGSSGLKLEFSLALGSENKFNGTGDVYALPAGLHYVKASIDNDNYRLIYIDYYTVVAAGDNSNNSTLEIKQAEVTLKATNYQKEYGQAIYKSYLNGTIWENAIVNIFDSHFVGCSTTNGCKYDATSHDAETSTINTLGANNIKNKYNSLANIYGYIVVANDGYIFASEGNTVTGNRAVITDTIYNNFYGVPYRYRANYYNFNADDSYGLLDGAGYYIITLENITDEGVHSGVNEAFATYSENDSELFGVLPGAIATNVEGSRSEIMIKRYTNYKITNREVGYLYILPARIDIKVESDQEKMYGCSYNGRDAAITWDRTTGYAHCNEGIGDYYDFGYKYDVYGDKTYELLDSKLNDYNNDSGRNFSVEHTISNYNFTSFDVQYNNMQSTPVKSYTVEGIVNNHSNSSDYNTVSYTVIAPNSTLVTSPTETKTLSNISLNNGVLYRANVGATENKYSYATYWQYASDALAKDGGKYKGFQNQSVGDYVLTLGNLDVVFNKNNQCDVSSVPTSGSNNGCKNFIVYKDGNNTSTHTKTSGGVESADNVDHVYENVEFGINKRTVQLHTEYNYKVYGDTDSLEGFTCAQIAAMYTRSSGYNAGVTFSFANRTITDGTNNCSAGNEIFINSGVSRYYAVDNSLAKAPWTKWSDNRQGSASAFYLYDDILFDVVGGLLARTNENGSRSDRINDTGINDRTGIYAYDWTKINVKTDYSTNYDSEVLSNTDQNVNYVKTSSAENNKSTINSLGFYAIDAVTRQMIRWYSDNKHSELSTIKETYNGYDYHLFKIDGSVETNYPFSTTEDNYGTVYYEIVKREIILVTNDANKVYGIEDTFALFSVKLCSEYDEETKECTLSNQSYGNRFTLAKDDYSAFFVGGEYNQYAIMGYDSNSGTGRLVGTDTNNTSTRRGSFGIYFYREPGENIKNGGYVIKACPTQLINGSLRDTCSGENSTLENGTDGTAYNAANYIVHTITGILNITYRPIDITPDDNQGFQYGNYETGTKIAPITYKESYTGVALENGIHGYNNNIKVNGLVNGSLGKKTDGNVVTDDSLANQYALCLFDISGLHRECINDRQNKTLTTLSSDTTMVSYTGQYTTIGDNGLLTSIQTGGTSKTVINHNVYNDGYETDNDTARFALDRSLNSRDGQRYNRNVGTYSITLGELAEAMVDENHQTKVCASSSETQQTNCLNSNYRINSFDNTKEYVITSAIIELTVDANQSKIYGQKDVELEFNVKTTFTTASLPIDYYYCGTSQDDCKQNISKLAAKQDANTSITINGFAYTEDVAAGFDSKHNYGKSKKSNKVAEYQVINQSTQTGLKYYDKYCLTTDENGRYTTLFDEFTCSDYTTGNVSSITYTSDTDRILLGYFYVDNWGQTQGQHNIRSGIKVALNEWNEVNYEINYEIDQDTEVKFLIDKLELQVSILDIVKTYGEATDAYKCENGNCSIRTSASDVGRNDVLLKALDNENRLEFNFNVANFGNSLDGTNNKSETGWSTDLDGTKIMLVNRINNRFYTQTASAEYKNIHLGLTVVRENGNHCTIDSDLFGCEDADTTPYKLRFNKSLVENNVDENYKLFIGGNEVELEETSNNYIAIARGSSKDTKTIFKDTDRFVKNYESATLTINKRDITFYIGTYDINELVNDRYTIEQDEMAPYMPVIIDGGIGYNGEMANATLSSGSISKRQVYYITWFDNIDPNQVFARQVRTSDKIFTNLTDAVDSVYGIAYCRLSIEELSLGKINDVNVTNCGKDNMIYQKDANAQNADGSYKFDTSKIGTYAIIRDKSETGVGIKGLTYTNDYTLETYEAKNYSTTDINGTLVIYEDSTPPVIEVGNSEYALESNAEIICNSDGVCRVEGKQVAVGDNIASLDTIGNIIKYLTENYSGFVNNVGIGKNLANTLGIINSKSSQNKDYTIGATKYCKGLNDISCLELFFKVNNPGVTTGTTTYTVDRTDNDYDWNESVIDSNLRAITSIISWFNITSYDYGYIRNNNYSTKRYTPRYYIYINGSTDNKLASFDPRYVGDFTISVYAIDNIGNVSDATTVTLHIEDKTKPVSGNLYLFNTQVKCISSSNRECATDINKWEVDTSYNDGYVNINNFVKYSPIDSTQPISDTNSKVDDANGIYIKLTHNSYTSLFSSALTRYRKVGSDYVEDVMGRYIKLTSSHHISALEVEHRYWTNRSSVFMVVVGGSDNSYQSGSDIDDSQWQHYYQINDSWYQYTRSAISGVEINTSDGIYSVVISALDSGRRFNTSDMEHSYYDNMYLIYGDDNVCNNIGCILSGKKADLDRAQAIVNDKQFTILGTVFTLNDDNSKVTWGTQNANEAGIDPSTRQFTAGLITCTFDTTFANVTSCKSNYQIVYKEEDKKNITISKFTLDTNNNINISDLHTLSEDSKDYYKDRKYVFIDTQAGSVTLNSDAYKIYEFGCGAGSEYCSTPYDEKYVVVNETSLSANAGTLSVEHDAINNANLTGKLAGLTITDIRAFSGIANEAKIYSPSQYSSGLVIGVGDSSASANVMSGELTTELNLNYFSLEINVYLAVRTLNDSTIKYYRFVTLWNGSTFDIYKIENTEPTGFANQTSYSNSLIASISNVENLLEELVSVANASTNASVGSEYHFDINYAFYDVAGNLSDNAVRGVTFIDLTSVIQFNITSTNTLSRTGDNTYSMNINQGMSLSTLLNGFTISNVNNEGVNNINSVKQSLYYNGEVVFENLAYNSDILAIIDDLASVPGTYTLRLTSERDVMSQGINYRVEDKPLEININVALATSNISNNGNYSSIISTSILLICASLLTIGIGYISLRKKQKR